jgi:hypothetical protein
METLLHLRCFMSLVISNQQPQPLTPPVEMYDNFLSYAITIRDEPFDFQGGLCFFLKKYSDSQCCWNFFSDFGGAKKKFDSEFLSYNLMLNSGKNFRDKKNKYSNSRVVRKKNSERNKKPKPPPPSAS